MSAEFAVRAPREVRNHHMDSRVWQRLALRPDDVIIATYAKTGTTWMQQIVAQILLGGREDYALAELSPWLDFRINLEQKIALLEAQNHRRFIKTHVPADALALAPSVRHIYVARDGRDVLWSMHHHHRHGNEHLYAAVNNPDGLVGPPFPRDPPDVVTYFRHWLDHDGAPWWPFFSHIRSWWEVRDRDNVLLVNFAELKRDLPGVMRRIAGFLGVTVREELWPVIERQCSFAYMKANAARFAPRGGLSWEGGAETFINSGTNGRWQGMLTPEDIARYEARARDELGEECARWLAGA